MATTVSELHTRIAYRLREKNAPDGVEASRRLQFMNEAQRTVIRKHFWWFTETTTSFNSVAGQESYSSSDGFPSNIRGSSILELRYNGQLYSPIIQTDAFNNLSSTYTNYSQSYFIFNKKLYPVPVFPASGTNNVTLKYYKLATTLTNSASELLIPDEYADIVVAFVVGRIHQYDGKRASASDAYDEFNEILDEMTAEQNNYLFALKSNENELVAIYE
mgnify:CR=1 FL=1